MVQTRNPTLNGNNPNKWNNQFHRIINGNDSKKFQPTLATRYYDEKNQ